MDWSVARLLLQFARPSLWVLRSIHQIMKVILEVWIYRDFCTTKNYPKVAAEVTFFMPSSKNIPFKHLSEHIMLDIGLV